MITVRRTFTVNRSHRAIFSFLSDFTATEQWDPGTVSTKRLDDGPVKVGSSYLNRSKFMGRETELHYRLETLVADQHLVFQGHNKTVTATDDISLHSTGSATEITYVATFEFKGLAKLGEPLLKRPLDGLADRTVKQMREVLGKL